MGFYYIIGLLHHLGWPKRRGLFNSEAIINSIILDSAIDQMIDWSASIGACRPNTALQIIATMFDEEDWNSKHSLITLRISSFLSVRKEPKEAPATEIFRLLEKMSIVFKLTAT